MKNPKTKQERFDYFAGLAMQSFIVRVDRNSQYVDRHNIANICYFAREFAKEMIKQIHENEQI